MSQDDSVPAGKTRANWTEEIYVGFRPVGEFKSATFLHKVDKKYLLLEGPSILAFVPLSPFSLTTIPLTVVRCSL